MTVSDLKVKIKSGSAPGWYVLCGEEEYLKRYYRNEIKKLICAEDDPFAVFNYAQIDGADFSITAFSEAVKAPPMMSDYKLIEWRFAELSKLKEKELGELISLAEEKSDYPYATVVITALPEGFDIGTPKRPSKLYTRLSKVFDIISFEKSTDSQLLSWLNRHFKAEGIEASLDVLNALIMRVGHSMQTLSFEVEKLAAYAKANEKSSVSVSDVEEITSASIECDAFAISNSIIEKNVEKAFLALADMKQQRIEAGAAIAQLSRTYADLMSIALFIEEGRNAADIAAIMKFHPYKLGLYTAAAKKLGSKKISESLSALIKADAASKAGGISGYEAVEIFITQNIGR